MITAKERAGRNRTIALTSEQETLYLSRCIGESEIFKDMQMSNRIIVGDCFKILPMLLPKSVDLLIVDPPYNLDKTFGTSKFRKMGSADYEDFTHDWIKNVLPALKETATIYVCCDWKTSIIVGSILSHYFVVQNRITWQREKGRGALANWKNSMEDIWFATVTKKYIFNVENVKQRRKVLAPYRVDGKPKDWEETQNGNFRDTYPSNFWDDISIPYWSMPENTDHPTQKPEKLFAKLVLASTNPGDLILDPFAGVGTSCVVAKKLGRQFIGIEKESIYCALAEKRLEMADTDHSIQGYSNSVFWERNSLSQQKKIAKNETTVTLSAAQESLFTLKETASV